MGVCMQSESKKEQHQNFEMNLYKTLGVEVFQKAVFLLEKIIHYKDKGKNMNYHIKNNHKENTNEFKKYLFYNGSIHVRNIIVLGCILGIKILFFKNSLIFNSFLLLCLVKDAYCVILQRYNYLRIEKYLVVKRKHEERKIETKKNKIKDACYLEKENTTQIEVIETKKQKQLIVDLKLYLNNSEDIYLDNQSIEQLQQLRNSVLFYNEINYNADNSESKKYLKSKRSAINEQKFRQQ